MKLKIFNEHKNFNPHSPGTHNKIIFLEKKKEIPPFIYARVKQHIGFI